MRRVFARERPSCPPVVVAGAVPPTASYSTLCSSGSWSRQRPSLPRHRTAARPPAVEPMPNATPAAVVSLNEVVQLTLTVPGWDVGTFRFLRGVTLLVLRRDFVLEQIVKYIFIGLPNDRYRC